MFGSWQDIVVTIVAFAAAATVVWRTVGHWREGTPGASPGCDHCAIKNEAMRQRGNGAME